MYLTITNIIMLYYVICYCTCVNRIYLHLFLSCVYAIIIYVHCCEMKTSPGQMIRDRIVVGIRDQSQSVHFQMDPRLNLEKAKTLVRQREAVSSPAWPKSRQGYRFPSQDAPIQGKRVAQRMPLPNNCKADTASPRQVLSL